MTAYVLAILVAFYALLCLAMYIGQGRLVFRPTRGLLGTPADIGFEYRDVEPKAADGTRLHGWWLPAAAGAPAVLYCHGNAGNIADRLPILRALRGLGLSVLIFDYRGYGKSGGRAGEGGTYQDAFAAWEHLTGALGMPPERIVLFGRSLGAAVAVQLAGRVRPAGLVLEAPFTSIADLAARFYPWLPARHLVRIRYDSAARIRDVRCPKLFLHSTADEVVPYGFGLRLFRAAGAPKTFVRLRGSHDGAFAESGERYGQAWREFLGSVGLGGGGA